MTDWSMPETQSEAVDSKQFSDLRTRLQEAEAELREALSGADASGPVSIAAEKLLTAHREVRQFLGETFEPSPLSPEGDADVQDAEIEIEREQHTLKPDAKDVLKALFMWRDDPVDRVKGTHKNSPFGSA